MLNFMAMVYLTLRHENSSVVNIVHMINYLGSIKPIYLQRLKQSSIRPPLLIVIDILKVASLLRKVIASLSIR